MPQYVTDIDDYGYYEFVLWNGEIYGVLEDEEHEEGDIVRLVTVEAAHTVGENFDALMKTSVIVPMKQLQLPDPVKPKPEQIRSFFRLDSMPWDLIKQGQFPFSSKTSPFEIVEEDLLTLIGHMPLFRNNFIWRNWCRSFLHEYDSSKPIHIKLPEADRPGFSFRYFVDRFFDMFEWYDPEEHDEKYFREFAKCYLKSKGKPLTETVLPKYEKLNMAKSLIRYVAYHPATDEIREYYTLLLDECLERGQWEDIAEYAYAYYGGNELVPCDWRKSEQAFLRLYDPDHESDGGFGWAANSLGYIYASKRLGEPDYPKAMRCFSYASKCGYIEATYKLSDGYRLGWDGTKDSEKAWEILSTLYKKTNKRNIAKKKYADICLRMGYCYRDGVGVKQDREKALDFFLKAKRGIEARKQKNPEYGDDVVERNILAAIESVSQE